jgi:hypothetical protein
MGMSHLADEMQSDSTSVIYKTNRTKIRAQLHVLCSREYYLHFITLLIVKDKHKVVSNNNLFFD